MSKIFLDKIKNYWKYVESKYPLPKYVLKVEVINFDDVKNILDTKNLYLAKKIIRDMYVKNVAFILRKSAPPSLRKILNKLVELQEKKKPSFHKMYDGTPNFHRIIDKKITKKYSVYAIKHSYFFYNWNIKSKYEKDFKEAVYKHWRYVKYLAGNSKKQYENNIPSQNQVDRLQIVNYPRGGGELRDHVDPRKNQRLVSGLIMSKIGQDFDKGGFYFKDIKNKKWNIEKKLNIGDSVMFYGSIIHGVDKIDPQIKRIDWKSKKARWFIGMFCNDSNHVKDRYTAVDLTKSVNFKK